MPPLGPLHELIERDGVAVLPSVFTAQTTTELVDACERALGDSARRHAIRNLLASVPAVRQVASSRAMREIVEPLIGAAARPVRAIYFDKLPGANWKVAWHQDLSIAVAQRRDVEGFGPWSVKDGVVHVEPPLEVLQQMITLRIALDDCGEEDGPLRVVSGSHQLGRLDDHRIREAVERGPVRSCTMAAGGVLVMRPLILHSSCPAQQPRHRRVVHIEFAAIELPHGLRWAEMQHAESTAQPDRF